MGIGSKCEIPKLLKIPYWGEGGGDRATEIDHVQDLAQTGNR